VGNKPGKFELAHGGTLLLDEVGEMPLPVQPKLLRALQEREFDRLGDTHSIKVDIRVVATTNRPLEAMVKEGTFRADLYYRLNVIPLSLPPLRERAEDVRELAEHFARQYAPAGRTLQLRPEFLSRLEQHDWPGNVRELANLMRRAVALSADEIGLDVLDPMELPEAACYGGAQLRAGVSLEEVERKLIEMTLEATGGNRSRAAEMLGVSLRTVRNKVRGYGLPPRRDYVHG
jgi:transcriptional regulator with PAS, ATPase and Fis domain